MLSLSTASAVVVGGGDGGLPVSVSAAVIVAAVVDVSGNDAVNVDVVAVVVVVATVVAVEAAVDVVFDVVLAVCVGTVNMVAVVDIVFVMTEADIAIGGCLTPRSRGGREVGNQSVDFAQTPSPLLPPSREALITS